MSRVMMIVVIAGVALLVGLLMVLRGSDAPDPIAVAPAADTPATSPSKRVGRSALSHGGPSPIKNAPADPSKDRSRDKAPSEGQ